LQPTQNQLPTPSLPTPLLPTPLPLLQPSYLPSFENTTSEAPTAKPVASTNEPTLATADAALASVSQSSSGSTNLIIVVVVVVTVIFCICLLLIFLFRKRQKNRVSPLDPSPFSLEVAPTPKKDHTPKENHSLNSMSPLRIAQVAEDCLINRKAFPENLRTDAKQLIESLVPSVGASVENCVAGGVTVSETLKNGSCHSAGLLQGDTIVKFDDKTVSDVQSFNRIIDAAQAGTEVVVSILRDGLQKSVSLRIGARSMSVAELAVIKNALDGKYDSTVDYRISRLKRCLLMALDPGSYGSITPEEQVLLDSLVKEAAGDSSFLENTHVDKLLALYKEQQLNSLPVSKEDRLRRLLKKALSAGP
jgi:hypothetical protein